jgi:ABC-type branched-subunit amino acid transport system substrate-binding protein
MRQDDAYGQAGLAGVMKALTKRNMTLAAEGAYERNKVEVKGALMSIRNAKPDAVIMIAAPAPAAEFIKLARKVKLDATFVNISFVGAEALAKALGGEGDGTVVTQVVPLPHDTAIPVVAKYQAALKSSSPSEQPGFISLEGYLVGRAIAAVLEKTDGEPTRKGLIEAVQKSGGLDFGGFKLAYGPDNNRGSNEVYLTVIQADGSFKQVTRLEKGKN